MGLLRVRGSRLTGRPSLGVVVIAAATAAGLFPAQNARQADFRVERRDIVREVTLSGELGARLVSSYSGWPTTVTPFAIVLGVGVSVTVALVSGVYPARRAATISPIEALRYE